ncbi:carboxypeptidase-like regulatory domain-containing protein [uncultured Croceitalea sp.]|uniref:carboxypeptidase-like regulatory domain-containing protein n=1 Tax=uncultured Croceitalea sp. TaxID=1798908 RepID=UPI0033059F48
MLLFYLGHYAVFGQETTISGEVIAEKSGEPIIGATIFYDGSSLGTITDIDGKFKLTTKNVIYAPLVVRSLGFETAYLPNLDTSFIRVPMKEAAIALSEVVLEPDTWSRAKKLKVFRREFLGFGRHRCIIENENDIRLYYNKAKKTLYAYAENPILIRNKKLGYEVIYDLKDFELSLNYDSAETDAVRQILYAGTMQFKDLPEKNNLYKKRRQKAYFGSKLHFFRALYADRLTDEGFSFYLRGFIVPLDKVFSVKMVDKFLVVSRIQKSGKLGVFYKDNLLSSLHLEMDEFKVDAYGNHSPAYGLLFSGSMGENRIAQTLPIDYEVPD